MKIIIGLGNPGEKYIGTRHNIGFVTLDYLLKKYEPVDKTSWENDKKSTALIKKVNVANENVLLAKPQTFMNNSGNSVAKLTNFFKIEAKDVIIIHDELDLPLGKMQIKFGGGSAGHNGIESVINSLGTDKFLRIRMGIGKPLRIEGDRYHKKHTRTIEDYVLQQFDESEHHEVRTMIKHIQKNLVLLLEHGIEQYMSKYNEQ